MASEALPYHHGDLRSALLDAGLALARTGGAKALGLRAVTRSVGVTPNAAYRHFEDRAALVKAVAVAAQSKLADSMLSNAPTPAEEPDAGRRAIGRLREIGASYIRFAISEPGWFELAFLTQDESRGPESFEPDNDELALPFRLLLEALDDMVNAGLLTMDQRHNAEWVCWAAVHGFADLATRGPLQGQDPAVIDKLADGVVEAVIAGLQARGSLGGSGPGCRRQVRTPAPADGPPVCES